MTTYIEQNRLLYTGVFGIILFLVFTATGGGLTGSGTFWMADWQHRAFSMFCHQDPSRSFWINGTPMAVCSRCYGIYIGLAVAWLTLPVVNTMSGRRNYYARQMLLATVFLNLVDLIGNFAGFWENTLVSRFILGSLTGLTAVAVLGGGFIPGKNKAYGEQLETKS